MFDALRAFADAVIDRSDVCPVCSYLWHECECGVVDVLTCSRYDMFTGWACDCDPAAYHRWNCAETPLWAQTMRDLDVNPWTVARVPEWLTFATLWSLLDYCGKGPCCMPGGHKGRCSM